MVDRLKTRRQVCVATMLFVAVIFTCANAHASSTSNVFTQQFGNQFDGQNTNETILTSAATATPAGSVSITAPANGATVAGTVNITTQIGTGVSWINVYVDSTYLRSSPPFSFSWNSAGVLNGSHTISARAYNTGGAQVATASVTLNVQNGSATPTSARTATPIPTPDVIRITDPTNGTTVGGSVPVAAQPGIGVSWVNFYIDGNYLTSTPPFSFSWKSATVSNGSHTISARAYNTGGAQIGTAAVSINVQNGVTNPTATATPTSKPTPTATATPMVTATSTTIATQPPTPTPTLKPTPTPGMITLRSIATASTELGGGSQLTIPLPTGAQVADLMVAQITVRGGSSTALNAPAGWTEIERDSDSAGQITQGIYYHVVTGTDAEPDTYTWTFTAGNDAAGGIADYIGVDTVAPIDASSGQANASSTSVTAPSTTIPSGNGSDRLLALFAIPDSIEMTLPGALTGLWNFRATGYGISAAMGDTIPPTGETGDYVATQGTSTVNLGAQIALRPAGGSVMASALRIDLDSAAHTKFGLYYPATYILGVPDGSSGLTAQYRYDAANAWTSLPGKTTSDFFNGISAARFAYASNTVYVSVPFSPSFDTIYLRIVNTAMEPVAISYRGISKYYDNRTAAVTIDLDDVEDGYLPDFVQAISQIAAKSLRVTVAVETANMNSGSWSTVQAWVNAGFTETASHTRTHPCSDAEYQVLGYTSEVAGSRDDLLRALALPNPFIPTFVEPCGFTSDQVRAAVAAAGYLVSRSVENPDDNFGTWSTDGFYDANLTAETSGWPDYTSYPNPGGTPEMLSSLNATFDTAYASGGIYHLLDHPWQKRWSTDGYLDQHASYIANRNDVWYATLGELYLYHYLQQRGNVTVTAQ